MRDRHRKAERAQHDPNFVFAQQKLLIKIDWNKVKKHSLAEPPKEKGKRDKEKTAIQETPRLFLNSLDKLKRGLEHLLPARIRWEDMTRSR